MKTVCCVMLAHGREAMVQRAIRAWTAQDYEERYRSLLILDSTPFDGAPDELTDYLLHRGLVRLMRPQCNGMSIGALRNNANGRTNADIILHWDSDDWSHPNRIAEQVALLESSGKEAVGYRDMLFWKCPRGGKPEASPKDRDMADHASGDPGEAWLYTCRNPHYCLGTSLCYWREVWQRYPFTENNVPGEDDTQWIRGLQTMGVLSLVDDNGSANAAAYDGRHDAADYAEPRMIASIHGGNTCAHIDPRAEEWKRVPEWDQHCREMMAL